MGKRVVREVPLSYLLKGSERASQASTREGGIPGSESGMCKGPGAGTVCSGKLRSEAMGRAWLQTHQGFSFHPEQAPESLI